MSGHQTYITTTQFIDACNSTFNSWGTIDEWTRIYRHYNNGIYLVYTQIKGMDGLEDTILYEGPDESQAQKAWDKA